MGLMKKLTSAVVASSLVLSLAAPVLAEVTADDAQAAYARLNYYGIAEGILREDGTKDPALDENLTRAQLVAMIVKAFGQKEYAEMLAGAQTFSDVPTSHWASGYLAIAKNIAAQNGNTIGYPDGTFGPENNVTAIEALAFVLKFLGVQVPGGDNWVEATIAAAKNAGVITDADEQKYLANPNEPATRGLAFAMADSIFYNYNGLDGKSVYTKYRDTEAPVVSLDAAPATTEKATIEITGKVSGDYREVYVGSDAITVAEDGTFSAQVALQIGTNTIEVSAKDWAGNVGSAKLVIERVAGQAAKIQIVAPEGPVVAGSTIDLPVLVVDAEGADTGLTDVTVDAGEAGTWAEGKLTAATKAGKYTITASYEGLETATVEIEIVAGPLAKVEAETKSVKPGTAVKLIGVDQYGNKVEGVTFAEAEDYAEAFIEGDLFIATKAGTYKVIGTKGEGEEAVKAEGTVSVFGEHASFTITVDGDLVANGATKHKVIVSAVDKDGNVVTDFDGEITLENNIGETLKKDAENGVATFEIVVPVGMEGLEAEFTAKSGSGDDEIVAEASFEVKAQVATAIKLTADKYLAINDGEGAFSGTVKVVDQLGKDMVTGESYEITLTLTGPAYFYGTTDKELTLDVAGGAVDFRIVPVDRYTEGTVTITATGEGLSSDSAEVSALYALAARDLKISPESDDAVAPGKAYEFKVSFVDRNGVGVKPDSDQTVTLDFGDDVKLGGSKKNVDIELEDPAGNTILFNVDSNDVTKGTFTYDANYAYVVVKVTPGKITGDHKVTASAKGFNSATGTVSFKAGEAKKIAFEKSKLSVLTNTEYTLTAYLTDDAGNKVAKADVEVVFTPLLNAQYVRINGKLNQEVKVKTDAEGKAAVTVVLLPYIQLNDTATIKVESGTLTPPSDPAEFTVVPSVSKAIRVTTYVYDDNNGWVAKSTVPSGGKFYVKAVVIDNNNVEVQSNDFDGRLVLAGIDVEDIYDEDINGNKVALSDLPDVYYSSAEKAYVTDPVFAGKAGSYRIEVKDESSATSVSGVRGFSITAGAAAKLGYTDTKVTYKPGEVQAITLRVLDKNDNPVSGSAVTESFAQRNFTVKIQKKGGGSFTGTEYGLIRETENGGGTTEYQVKLAKGVSSYKLYFVTNVESDVEIVILEGSSEVFKIELVK